MNKHYWKAKKQKRVPITLSPKEREENKINPVRVRKKKKVNRKSKGKSRR